MFRGWTVVGLLAAKTWWLTEGVALMGKRSAYEAVAQIDLALKAR